MNLLLTGFMGSGKSTVGRAVARRLGCDFVDLDDEIERRAGISVREIFDRFGEPRFRDVEREALREALARDRAVVATGGGTLCIPENLQAVRGHGVVVWLNPPFAAIMRRIGGRGKRDRPLFRDETAALALYRERLAAYRAAADLAIEVDPREQAEEVAGRIVLRLKERSCVI